MTVNPRRPRYGSRAAFALRPSAEAVESHGLAQTALDRPKFTDLGRADAAADDPRPVEPRRDDQGAAITPSRATRAILVLAVATLAAVLGAGFGVWLVTRVAS